MNQVAQSYVKQGLLLGKKLEKQNNFKQAVEVYNQIVNQSPQCEEALTRLIDILMKFSNYKDALKCLNRALTVMPHSHSVHLKLGFTLLQLKQHKQAVEHYRNAIAINDKPLTPYIPLADTLDRLGELDSIEPLVTEKAEKYPKAAELQWLMAKFAVRRNAHDEAEAYYQRALKLKPLKENAAAFYVEFAKTKERIGDYSKAFDYFQRGQFLSKQQFQHVKINRSFSDNIINTHGSAEVLQRIMLRSTQVKLSDDQTGPRSPVFIVGFPRSGTTLMERVLSSHSQFLGNDESQGLTDCIYKIDTILGRKIETPEDLSTITNNDIIAFRAAYFEQMAPFAEKDGRHYRILDKNPVSIIYLPYIKLFFPDSPVIAMQRDPRDVVLSCFCQAFGPTVATINFYDLKQTTRYYTQIMKYFDVCKTHLSLNLLEIAYEEFCTDFEATLRDICEVINVPFEEQTLHFDQASFEHVVTTPSYEMVRQPIQRIKIGHWKHYEKQLQPFMPQLAPFLPENKS